MQAFAFQLYERFLNGATVEQLARELGIPADRIAERIRAAAQYRKQRPPA